MTEKKVRLTRPERRSSAGEVDTPLPSRTHGGADTRSPARAARRTLPEGEGGAVRVQPCGQAHVRSGIDELLDGFRLLTQPEKKRALALMSLELQNRRAGVGGDLELWSEAVYEALAASLGPSDVGGHGPQVVRRVAGLPANWGPVEDFFAASGLSGLGHANERLGAYRTVARLVVAQAQQVARRAGIPLGPKLVGTVSQQVAGIFDNAFPGYVRAGLAHMVARAPRGARQLKQQVFLGEWQTWISRFS